MEQKSQMVLAEKYELQVRIPGTSQYQKDGQRRLVHEKKLVPRAWAEQRNQHSNNELYVLFEEETDALMKQRQANIKNNAIKEAKSKMSMGDLIDVVAGKSTTPVEAAIESDELVEKDKKIAELEAKLKAAKEESKPEPEVSEPVDEPTGQPDFDGMEVPELQKYCDDNGIKYHHKAGKEKLIEIITENQ